MTARMPSPASGDVLLVIDVQNDFIRGSLATPRAERIIAPVNRLAAAFRNVVVAQDWHPPGHVSFASSHAGAKAGDMVTARYGLQKVFPDHCIQGTEGAALDPGLDLAKAELILRKGHNRGIDSFSAFRENDRTTPTGLASYLRERGFVRVVCVGLTRYGCVADTAIDAVAEGFAAIMVEDACMDVDDGRDSERRVAQALARAGVLRVESAALPGG